MPYDVKSLQTVVDETLNKLEREKPISPQGELKIKLLNKIKEKLNSEAAKGFCAAINCLEDGGYFSHKMIRALVKLIPETSCGQTAIFTVLSLSGQKIEFSKFLSLMTRGELQEGLLHNKKKNYFDVCPQLKKEGIVKIHDQIGEKDLIERMMQESDKPAGLYLFVGTVNTEVHTGHTFIFIKGNEGKYYFSDAFKQASNTLPLTLWFEYKAVEGTYVYPFSSIEENFNLRLKELSNALEPSSMMPLSPPTSDSKIVLSPSTPESAEIHYPPSSPLRTHYQVTTPVSLMVGRRGPGHGLLRVTSPSTSTIPDSRDHKLAS